MAWACTLGVRSVFACKYKSLKIPTLLQSSHRKAKKEVLVDSGATDNFISSRLLKRMKIGSLWLKKPQMIWNIDGTHNKARAIMDYVDLQVHCGPQTKDMKFLVTELGEDDIILGYPWLAAFQPKIDWKESILKEGMQPFIIKTLRLNIDDKVKCVKKAWIHQARSLATPGEEIFITRGEEENLRKTSMAAQMAANAKPKEEKTWDQIIPPHYHKWKKVFSKTEAARFPEHQPWDIAINFTEEAPKSLDCKIYPLTVTEQGQLDNYINENLEKGYI